MKKMGCAKCGGTKYSKGGAAPKKMQKGGSMGIVGMPKYGNNPMTDEGRVLQKGGSFAPNRAVQSSCKNGMVRDENGRCVMQRKMAKGGSSDFGMLSVKAGVDKNPNPTAADRIAGATKKMQKGGNWIQGAIKKPGALRESLGVKKGEKIPKGKLAAAAKKGGKLGQRARLAMTLGKMRKK